MRKDRQDLGLTLISKNRRQRWQWRRASFIGVLSSLRARRAGGAPAFYDFNFLHRPNRTANRLTIV